MKLAEIRDIIRSEGNVKGLREYQTLVDNFINQEMQRFTGRAKWMELYTTQSNTLTAAQDTIALPTDFQLFEGITYIRFNDTKGNPLGKGTIAVNSINQDGSPRYYIRNSTGFFVYPFSDIVAGDTLVLGYYKKPELILDTDELPVPALETAIIQAALSRLLRMSSSHKSQMARQEAEQAYINARAEAQSA